MSGFCALARSPFFLPRQAADRVRGHTAGLVLRQPVGCRAALRFIVKIDITERLPVASRTMNGSACSSMVHGGGKRRMGVMSHFRFAPKATIGHPEAARR
jgi:hypothetical protein